MKYTDIRNLLLLIITLIAALYTQPIQAKPKKGPSTEAIFVYAIDGDTIVAKINNRKRHIRLIGIDTPESKPNDKAYRDNKRTRVDVKTITHLGKLSTEYLRALLKEGDQLKLEYDVTIHDRYDRILAYVYLPDGSMLNEKIVASGYASVMTVPPDVKYVDRFQKAFQHAKTLRLGLWRE